MLLLLQGPAGAGKSQVVRQLLDEGRFNMLADFTPLWAALGMHERDSGTGLYPTRTNLDPLVASGVVAYVKSVAVRYGISQGLDVIVTTSRRGEEEYWQDIAEQGGTTFQERTIDPGESVVRERLRNPLTNRLDDECEDAIGRWY